MFTIISFKKTVLALALMLMTTAGAWAQTNWSGTINLSKGQTVSGNITLTGNTTVTVTEYAYIDGVISSSGNYSVTLKSGILIYFRNNTYTGNTIIESGGTLFLGEDTEYGMVAGNIVNDGTLNFFHNDQVDYFYPGIISGSGEVIKRGDKLILTGANTYTGKTTVKDGILQIGDGTSTTASINSDVTVDPGATLRFEPGANMTFSKVISGKGKVELKGNTSSCEMYFTADNTCTGTTTVEAGSLLLGGYSTAGMVAGDIILNANASLYFIRTDDIIYSGIISGTGQVNKYGTNKLTLNNVNTYMGTTTITAGTGTLALGVSGSIENSAFVNFGDNAKFDVSAGNKKIKGFYSSNADAEVILGTRTLTIGTSGGSDGGGTYAGKFSGTGSVQKFGSATLTLTNAGGNTTTGTFDHVEGTVDFSGNWNGAYDKQNGTTLIVTGNLTFSRSMDLRGGNINMNPTAATPSKITASAAYAINPTTINISGSPTTSSYTLMETTSAFGINYPTNFTLSGVSGYSLTANATQLMLTKGTAIPLAVTNPADVTVTDGQSASFSVTASGGTAPYTYLWQYKYSGGEWQTSTATGTTYVLRTSIVDNGSQYRCIVTDAASANVTSGVATLTVEKGTGIDEAQAANPLKAWMRNGLLHIEGLTAGEPLNIYTVAGTWVYNGIAASAEADIPLARQGVYIVKAGENVKKVVNSITN